MSERDVFLLFAGDDYYPSGGADDCQGVFDSLEAAQAARGHHDWSHVARLNGGALVIVSEWCGGVRALPGGRRLIEAGWYDPDDIGARRVAYQRARQGLPPLPPQDPADAADRLGRRMGV